MTLPLLGINGSKVSRHFSAMDVVFHSKTIGRNIDNLVYEKSVHAAVVKTAKELDKLCDEFGPIDIRSWFRCEELERIVSGKAFTRWCGRRNLPENEESWAVFFMVSTHAKGCSVEFAVPFGTTGAVVDFVTGNLEFDRLFVGTEGFRGDTFRITVNDQTRKLVV